MECVCVVWERGWIPWDNSCGREEAHISGFSYS